MAISEQRLNLFALISEFEVDLRYQIESKLESEEEIKLAIGSEAYQSVLSRLPQASRSEAIEISEILENLDLADELKLLFYLDQRFSPNFRKAFQNVRKRVFELCPIRNRVMHRRPLAFEDYPTTQLIIGTFHKLSPTEFVNVGEVYNLIAAGQLSRSYRSVELEENSTLLSNNLPQPDFDDTGFIGRGEKIKELRKAIEGPYPVITILGVGGVGKTALTLQVAYDLASDPNTKFEAIVWLSAKATRLTGSDIENVIGAISNSTEMASLAVDHIVGLEEGDPFAQLQKILESFRVLLIFDNLETVLDEKIRAFVRNVPDGSKIIFTSRVGLGAFDFTIQLAGLTPKQSISYFKRVSDVWGQAELVRMPEEDSAAYVKRLNYSPLGIKWFIQAVSKGSSAQKLLANPELLLSFCLDNILDKLSDNARDILNCLAISGKDQSPASISYLCELESIVVDDVLTELLTSNLIQVISGRFGDDDRYKIAFLAIGYISRFKPPNRQFQERIQRRLGQLKAATERALANKSDTYVYDPSYIYIRENFADTDAVAAHHLKSALSYCREKDYSSASEMIDKARNLAPTYFEVHKVEAFIAAKEGNNLLAMSAYEEAFALRSDYPPLLLLFAGFLLRRQDEHDRALELLEAAINIDPTSFALRSELTRSLMYQQEMHEAWEALRSVDVESLPTARAERIHYDLLIDVCKRGLEQTLGRHEHADFIVFAERLETVLLNAPDHIWDGLIVEKLSHAAALSRKFIAKEGGSPLGQRIEQVRAEILGAIRVARGTEFSDSDQEASIPSGKLNSDERFGRVVTLKHQNSFGFVEEMNTQERYFFHRKFFNDAGEFDDLAIGDVLRFNMGENRQGPCAVELRRD